MKLLPAAFDLPPSSEAAEHEPRLEDSDALSCATRSLISGAAMVVRTLGDGGGSSDGDGRRLAEGPGARRCAGMGSDSRALKPPNRDRPERLPGIITPLAEALADG